MDDVAEWFNAIVCKTIIREFESHHHLLINLLIVFV